MDVESQVFGLIDGVKEFLVLGNSVTLDNEGEYVKILNKKTLAVVCTASVLSVSKGQRARCKLPGGGIPAGNYICEVATRTLLEEATPRIFRKAVEVKAAAIPNPSITKVYSAGKESTVAANPQVLYIVGSDLGSLTKDNVSFKCMNDAVTIPASASWTFTDGLITIDNGESAISTGGAMGDSFVTTITVSGSDPVTFTTTIG